LGRVAESALVRRELEFHRTGLLRLHFLAVADYLLIFLEFHRLVLRLAGAVLYLALNLFKFIQKVDLDPSFRFFDRHVEVIVISSFNNASAEFAGL
jgi:hypothetical protein